MRSALKLFFIGLSLCSSSLALEPVTSGIAFVTAIGGSMLLAQYETLKCKVIECCDGSWIKFNSTGNFFHGFINIYIFIFSSIQLYLS